MSGEKADPRVFTIPAGAPFLPILADALLARRLVQFGDDPLDLASVTVLLPTRRAVRAFRDVLVERLGGEAAILPTIRPIGDVDEEEALLDPGSEALEDQLSLPRSVSPLVRRLILTRLVLAWGETVSHAALQLKEGERPRVARSAADATRLAGDLARLIDDMEIGDVPWQRLAALAPEDHAAYYGLTLDFLRVVTEQWPDFLAAQGLVDPARRRNTLIAAATRRLKGPVIAAGSTGSIPTTALLLKAVAGLPNGAVVLPGLDQQLDDAGWKAVGGDEAVRQTHPQYGLKQLIERIGILRSEIDVLGDAPLTAAARTRLVSEAMRPADTLEAWTGFRPAPDALAGAGLIVARNEQEEALAIALALREAIEKSETAALVTPDRTLARRVAAELGRWNLTVDDSAGRPLESEPHGVFARLVVEAAALGNPLNILALLKHPLAAFGTSRHECQEAARALELLVFRGHRLAGTIADLPQELAKSLEYLASEEGRRRAHPARKDAGERRISLATTLAQRVAEILGPLQGRLQSPGVIPVAETTDAVVTALVAAGHTHGQDEGALWEGAGGRALATLFDTLREDAGKTLAIPAAEYPYFLSAVMAEASVVDPRPPETRIHIWGALEARLQSVDVLVLGALDEGVWPTATRTDPWLSRAMRTEIGLTPPERRVGLAAHDFAQGMANAQVIVTRAEKRGGAPTVESRWLQRLAALAGKDAVEAMRAEGARYLRLARALDRPPPGRAEGTPRPAPKPPVALRPRSLSITEVETLIRDPYAIYAKHVLKLRPLDDIGLKPDRALRGTLIHDALGNFTKAWQGDLGDGAERELTRIGDELLQAVAGFPDVHRVWRYRFEQIARWFLDWERGRDAAVARRLAEIEGKWNFEAPGGGFTLRGRADRIDAMADGSVTIYDFKTGTPQTQRTLYAGLTPQLDLEAAMVRAGAFPDVTVETGSHISDLAWLSIGKVGRGDPYQSAVKKGETADGDADKAAEFFRDLIFTFDIADHPYLSRTRPMLERWPGDYDHLARAREWALLESGDDYALQGIAR